MPLPDTSQQPDWKGLWLRTQRSAVTTLDIARILGFDGIILLMGNGIVSFVGKVVDSKDGFFALAEQLSHGLFLLLYGVTVAVHVVEFIREQRV